ncbi:LacI family DNA-binding transcriptional regulator [Lacisediminihabitans changchengi]|uniref:LacI family DNA-binding transcriptional regulator n=1 Tax=Lacisediminihabitans changchengi TaxID=2787634 RepID=A0A934W4J5_9MICO|nr:LacI family DNA-binding transcriptional regulator [Lacisediminihabitans changchengi]MBK4349036.1 LacI family DNA-binding transcriptional regulator [Lacisediminihabitans changchengi]
MRDVARLAGVGTKTVSRVINAEPNVSAATLARVNDAIAHLNYEPDIHAGSLRRRGGVTRTIGLLVGSVANPFAGSIHRAVEDRAIERGFAVFASSLDEDPSRERNAVSAFIRRRVDGVILTRASSSQAYLLPEIERGLPMVFVDRPAAGIDTDSVLSDNVEGAALATRHLIDRGHQRIAFLGDRADIWTAGQRREGFLREIGQAGISTRETAIVENLEDETTASEAVLALLRREQPPTAIFSSQNLITIGAIRALRVLELQRRVALVGFDDLPMADLLEPGISVVSQNPSGIGDAAARQLFARLDGDRGPIRKIVVPTQFIARGSGEILPPA